VIGNPPAILQGKKGEKEGRKERRKSQITKGKV
jgi:hypothetical protein